VKAHNQGGGREKKKKERKKRKEKKPYCALHTSFRKKKECKCTKHVTWETTLHVAQILNTEWLQNHIP